MLRLQYETFSVCRSCLTVYSIHLGRAECRLRACQGAELVKIRLCSRRRKPRRPDAKGGVAEANNRQIVVQPWQELLWNIDQERWCVLS